MHHPKLDHRVKVGFDAKRYYNNPTGLGNYARWIINGLKARDELDVHLYHPAPVAHKEGLDVHGPEGLLKTVSFAWRSRYISKDLARHGIDVYHGMSNEIPFGIHRRNIRTLTTIHDLINLRFPEQYRPIDRTIYFRKLRYAQRFADMIVVPSEQTRSDLIHFFDTDPTRIRVIPLSIPTVPKVETDAPERPYILCVSSFQARKNLPNLVRAFEAAKLEDVDLVIAGREGDSLQELERITQHNDRIKLVVNPATDTIHHLYHHSLFCVYPSMYEGFGIPILEAFAHGKTIATSNVSSMPEVGGTAAEYFDPNDVDSIKIAIVKLMDDMSRTSLQSNIENELERFDSEALLQEYIDLYQALAFT